MMRRKAPIDLKSRQTAYRLAFGSPAGQEVMRDLAKFCRANETCFHPDPRVHAVAEGRREVWLRITNHFHLPLDQLFDMLGGVTIQSTGDDE